MKKRLFVLLMAGCLMAGSILTGCSSKAANETAVVDDKQEDAESDKQKEAKKAKDQKKEESSETEEDKDTGETAGEVVKVGKNAGKSGVPVLGGRNTEGYDKFKYLYEEVLISEEDEEQQITIYIPEGDYYDVDMARADAEEHGVSFTVKLNPYVQYDQGDYSPEENLQVYLDDEYDEFYTTDLKALEISDIEEIGDDAARATVKYCEYESWDEDYAAIYTTYCYHMLEPDLAVLTKVEINSKNADADTKKLLKEIESFYNFEIEWNAKEAEEMIENYLENSEGETETFSTGFLKFDLPSGWKEDIDYSEPDMSIYAPGGDLEFSGCAVIVMEKYIGYEMDDFSKLFTNNEFVEEFLEAQLGEDIEDFTVEEYGETSIGETVVITCSYVRDDMKAESEIYLSGNGYSLYAVQALQSDRAEEDALAVAEDIVINGKLNN